MRSLLRPVGVIAFGLSPVLLVAACGTGDDETTNTPLVAIGNTSYVVKEPATTTTIAPDLSAGGGISAAAQVYTVVAGDAVYSIAARFDVDPVEMANFNDWPEGVNHFLAVGDVVNIPPGGRIPGAETDEEDDPATDDTDDDTDSTETDSTEAETDSTDAPPSGSGDDCEAGTHTITADDTTRLKVAEKYDVTVEALDAANANTAGYGSFYPGLEIVIPCVA